LLQQPHSLVSTVPPAIKAQRPPAPGLSHRSLPAN